jgi:putative heme-binding domain-containing protein
MLRSLSPALLLLCLLAAGLPANKASSQAAAAPASATASTKAAAKPRPLKALLVAGGCCHDYAGQHEILRRGIEARAQVQVDVIWTDDKSVNPPLPLYEKDDWARGYDIILHDECAAGMRDPKVLERILKVHETLPSLHLHCAMHSFRTGGDAWFKHLGLQSSAHGPQEPIAIRLVDPAHPITATLRDWTTIREELYNNVNLLGAHPLAMGRQLVKLKDGSQRTEDAVVAWTHERQGVRSFSTSLGHNSATVSDPRYLELVTRGLLWACKALDAEHLQAFSGQSQVRFVKAKPVEAVQPPPAPKNALGVKATASSEERGKSNFAWRAVDGDLNTRWCAANPSYPQWLQLELDQARELTGIETHWESQGTYRHRIEGSLDGKTWRLLVDASQTQDKTPYRHRLAAKEKVRLLRVHALGKSSGGWASIREVVLQGTGLPALAPKLSEADKKEQAKNSGPYANQGNVPPSIVKLSAQQEAEILRDVKIAKGFEVSLFAPANAANYPVFVAAATNGTLYVSSDGNGSLGRNPKRGRILRLRDLDGDGRADESKVFAEVDSPRGLVWDQDRLYLVHPPHLSEFIDADGDGRAEKQNILVRDLAFGFKDRPADHTTNGLSLGLDGKLYVAGGDFGFLQATGSDGKTLQHRGGGVIRLNTDGSGLEIYSTGTRNILEVAVSPRLDLFARDNTNDGGGWNVRFHHFTGLDDHGYPRLYKNFSDEAIAPLADYGGGSGCGAVYLDEPGFGAWNDAALTADWGSGALWHHQVRAKGASFEETREPEPLVRLTRPTDGDVDGLSRLYVASWKGATFNWEGPDVGYIVQLRPKGYKPPPLPDFTKLDEQQLLSELQGPSQRRRLEAMRQLQRRGANSAKAGAQWLAMSQAQADTAQRAWARRLEQGCSADEVLRALGHEDAVLRHMAIRAAARDGLQQRLLSLLDDGESASSPATTSATRALALIHKPEVVSGLIERLQSCPAGPKREAMIAALCRLHFKEGNWKGESWGTRPDTRGPYYQPEPWSESPRIAEAIKALLAKADANEAAFWVREINRNRIQSSEAQGRILALASKDPTVLPELAANLAGAEDLPAAALPLLIGLLEQHAQHSPTTLSQAIVALSRSDSAKAVEVSLSALSELRRRNHNGKEYETAASAFFAAPKLENHHLLLEQLAAAMKGVSAREADAALLSLAARQGGSPEARELSAKALDLGWTDPKRRVQILEAIAQLRHQPSAGRVLASMNDADAAVKAAAQRAASALRLQRIEDNTPKVGSLKPEQALAQVLSTKGHPALGEQIFQRATCTACHTVRESEAQKGPYLGNIAQTYKRAELAQNILDPNRSIAQGFASELITLKDGSQQLGFITLESANEVKLRDITSKETVLSTANIAKRQKLPTSLMPPGLMQNFSVLEFASLLDYLEKLAKP